jgi:EAL domain-containing protein (putative c-di-GMP-specific phosphodiesterase class I)
VYQPIFELRRAQIIGFESLARFTTTPLRSPHAWFTDAATAGLDIALETKVIERALASFTSLPQGVYITFNVSPNIVANGQLERAFSRAPLDRIVLEINEHVSVREYGEIAKVLAPLRERGLRISVDETGAGITSFHHIVALKPNIIKLHMSLTRSVDTDAAKRAIIASVVQFARDHGTELIAEGVETAGELKALRTLGVMRAQGYLLGRPAPLSTAVKLCERHPVVKEEHPRALAAG